MKFQMYRSGWRRQWRWRLKAENGRIIADSAESYHNRHDCQYAIETIKQFAYEARVEEL